MSQPRGRGQSTPQPDAAEGNTDTLDALLQLVAAKHHVLLGRDDPILILQTMNELLVAQTAAGLEHAQNAALAKFCDEIESNIALWTREAKGVVERSLEASCRVSTEQIAQARHELVGVLELERKRTTETIRHATVLNTSVLVATVLIVVGTLWLR